MSIGITHLPENDHSVDKTIHRADSVLCAAKNSGKNCVDIFPK
ncbi:diguanylate cyclase [Mesotoga sp. H07.pep.5.3]